MGKWEQLKVAELKDELKSRGIPLTGLKLKKDFVDKLEELDAEKTEEDERTTLEEKTNGAIGEVDENEEDVDKEETRHQDKASEQPVAEEDGSKDEISPEVEADRNLAPDRPPALKVEDSQTSTAEEDDTPPAPETVAERNEVQKYGMFVPEVERSETTKDQKMPKSKDEDVAESPKQSQEQTTEEQGEIADPAGGATPKAIVTAEDLNQEPSPTPIVSADEINHDAGVDDVHETQRKRKRSLSGTPTRNEVQKKARGENGKVVATRHSVSRSRSRSTSTARDTAKPENLVMENGSNEEEMDTDNVEPAKHMSTRTLYMRNFKRPLNIRDLKEHVTSLARGAASAATEGSPIKLFFVDKIRTHAFITFESVTQAARVRSVMHRTVFPPEPQREEVWIDFIPDDKAQVFIDIETRGNTQGFGGGGSSEKFEVFYDETDDGIEAVLRESNASFSRPQRPGIGPAATSRSSIASRTASYAADPSRIGAIASDVHPDRLGIIRPSPAEGRRPSSPQGTRRRESQSKNHVERGTGFKALDDLFSSTSTKPKLYFKPVSDDVVQERLDLIKDLYPDRGNSGDAGMKRYSFETYRGHEAWTDNGPEFGNRNRGLARLEGSAGGRGRGRGGFRGRGGAGRFGGDSYRGGGWVARR